MPKSRRRVARRRDSSAAGTVVAAEKTSAAVGTKKTSAVVGAKKTSAAVGAKKTSAVAVAEEPSVAAGENKANAVAGAEKLSAVAGASQGGGAAAGISAASADEFVDAELRVLELVCGFLGRFKTARPANFATLVQFEYTRHTNDDAGMQGLAMHGATVGAHGATVGAHSGKLGVYDVALRHKLEGVWTNEEWCAMHTNRWLIGAVALTTDWRANDAVAADWRTQWTRMLEQVAATCPWLFFDDTILPPNILSLLSDTRFAEVAWQLCCPLACILLATMSMKGVPDTLTLETREALRTAVATLPHRHPHLHDATSGDCGRTWAAVRDHLARGRPEVSKTKSPLDNVPFIQRACRMFARRMHAACTACGRVPFADADGCGQPLQFCSGTCTGTHGKAMRCKDRFCDAACQRQHRRKTTRASRCGKAESEPPKKIVR
jgi:hypothetical protein